MFYAYWGLTHAPFVGGDVALFYEGESQSEALARLRFAADEHRQALLLGEPGAGKTLLLAHFARQRARRGQTAAHCSLAGVTPREMLWRIASGMSLSPRPDDDSLRLLRRLEEAAGGSGAAAAAVLLLDDVDQAGADVLSQLYRLLARGGARDSWPTVVLAARPKGLPRLGEQLLELLDLRIDLEPWGERDVTGYLQHSLVQAGADGPVFDDEALAALYGLTGGIPRRVNRLADHALLGAAAEGRDAVDAAMVEAAHDALQWSATTA
jgi:general secretion pathway protein A